MSDEQPLPENLPTEANETESRYPDLDVLQQEINRRLRDNQKFLDHFLDDDFMDELDQEEQESPADPDDFEEL